MRYTAVTTIFNDKHEVVNLINNLEQQTLQPEELIIVDGGSGTETISIVEKYIKTSKIPIRYILGDRLNISQGFNRGIRETQTEYLAIVAVGNSYKNDFFELLADRISKKSLDYAYSPFYGQDDTKFSKLYNQVYLNKNKGMKLDIASNHGVLIKKSVFEELGYFYEKFIYAGEDLEFYEKVKQNKYNGEIVEDAKVYWDTPHTWKSYKKQIRVYAIGRMQIYGFLRILKAEKIKFIYSIGMVAILVLSFSKSYRYMGTALLMIYLALNFYKSWKHGIDYTLLKNCSYILPVYYYVTRCKYMMKRYKVDNIERLR